MSDLLSPILYVIEDESESFWSFAALMERMAPNFHRDQNGMHSQLLALSKVKSNRHWTMSLAVLIQFPPHVRNLRELLAAACTACRCAAA